MAYTIYDYRREGLPCPPQMVDNIFFDQPSGRMFLILPHRLVMFFPRNGCIGRGGMGQVFLGKDYATGEQMAIKMVHARYADIPEVRRRARDEASHVFSHPNMIEMIGYAESLTGTGPIYIVSKYVNGANIDDHLKMMSNADPYERQAKIVDMLMPVLSALEYLHQKGITHLDIKPSNIMVQNGRNMRLMDLGIASVAQRTAEYSGSEPVDSSSGSGLAGTPKYAAPEQFNHSYGSVNQTSDIYEFAVTLYELLSGINPFIADTLDEALSKHVNEPLPRATLITEPMLKVLRRAAHPNQSQRYQSVAELRQALLAAAAERPGIMSKIKGIFNRK